MILVKYLKMSSRVTCKKPLAQWHQTIIDCGKRVSLPPVRPVRILIQHGASRRTSGNAAGSPAMLTTALHRTGHRDTSTQEELPPHVGEQTAWDLGPAAGSRPDHDRTAPPRTNTHMLLHISLWCGYASAYSLCTTRV